MSKTKKIINIYVLISFVFAILIVLVPTFLALAANVPSNLNIQKSTISNTAMTVSWTNSGIVGSNTNDIWVNGYINASLSTNAANVTYAISGLASGVNYKVKVRSRDNAGTTDWSFAAAGITKTSGGGFAAPHASFADNSNMCSACHSIHKSRTRFKLLYSRYSELTSQYTDAEPGVDLCFNCHDGTGADNNVQNQYQGGDGGDAGWVGHKIQNTAGLSSATTGNKGWKMPPATQTTSVGQQLPCMVCHDAHISSKGNWRMLADGLYDYSISSSGGLYDGEWRTGTTLPWEQNTGDNKVTDTTTDTSQTELCTVCHHGSSTDNEMIVKGIDLYWNTSHDSSPTGGNKNCKSCHTGPHNLSKGAGYPPSQQDLCNCHDSGDDPYVTQMDAESNTSLHYVNKSADNYPPTSNSCTFRCHDNHGERNPTRAFNVWVDQGTRLASADYDFTASVSAPGLCLSCHSQRQTTVRPGGQTSNSSAYVSTIAVSPFISSAHSYRSESYRVGGYDSGAPTTGTGTKQFAFRASCLKCHRSSNQVPTSDKGGKYGPHASANRSLLVYPAASSVSALPGSNPGDEEQTCFWCHSPSKDQWANRAMATVAWRISQAFTQDVRSGSGTEGHALNLVSGAIDRHRASEGFSFNWMPSTSRHVECQDCHNPHAASQGYNYWANLPYTLSVNELESPSQGVISKQLSGVWGVSISLSGVPTAANYITVNGPVAGSYSYVASATKQWQICLKCHSSYAYGSSPSGRPIIPSGRGVLVNPQQTDILMEFNPKNYSYHPVFSKGKFQPTNGQNTAWGGGGGGATGTLPGVLGYSNNFVPPFSKDSLITCSDCHGSSSSSYSRGYYTSAATVVDGWDFPRGPHGSSRGWILRRVDRSIEYNRTGTTRMVYNTYNPGPGLLSTAEPNNFCLNCHRVDIYGYRGSASHDPAYQTFARISHGSAMGDNRPWAGTGYNATTNPWGSVCMFCHGGGSRGGIHGSSRPGTGTGINQSGYRLNNGASWDGTNPRPSTTVNLGCDMNTSNGTDGDGVTNCGNGAVQGGPLANYNYDPVP